MRCSECGSDKIAVDKGNCSHYCRKCGLVLEENNFQ